MPIANLNDIFGPDGFIRKRWRVLLAGAGAIAALGVLVIALWLQFGPPPSGKVMSELTCESCGQRWKTPPGIAPKCPKCGAIGYVCAWYRCPHCGGVFMGTQSKRMGEYEALSRRPGDKEWSAPGDSLTCPKCNKEITGLLGAVVGLGWNEPSSASIPMESHPAQ